MIEFDKSYLVDFDYIIGLDEAGRGPLAGPVVVASAIMPLDNPIKEINDSKKLSAKKREMLYKQIITQAIEYHVSVIDHKEVDAINVYQASKQGMLRCLSQHQHQGYILTDAMPLDISHSSAIIKGDAKSYSIACASIIAKVTRDRIMAVIDQEYPQYGFIKHQGYPTKLHFERLEMYGPCEYHRVTFNPVKRVLEKKQTSQMSLF